MTIPSLEQPKIEIESAPTPESPSVPGRPQNSDTAIVPLPQSRSRSPLKRWSHRIAWTLLFTGTALSAAVAGALIATTTPLPGWLVGESSEPLSLVDLWQSGFRYRVTRPVNILLLGVDEVPDATPGSEEVFSGRTDTMLLARFNPDKSTLSVLSIPRDTRVEVPGDGIAKINHANIVGGPEKVAETIQSNLGPVAIDRYVRVNTEGVRELIDLIGGVEVYVPQPMVYEDKTQGLYINLQPGWQTLNGDQAEQFARFRSDGQGDIGRVQRQQILLQALRERLMSPRVIPQLPQMIRVMLRYIDTNLSLEEILALANFSMELGGTDNLRMVMLPGRFSTPEEYIASYWLIDPQASQQVMNEFFQLDTVALLSNTESRAVSQLRIAVQNASDVTNSAQAVARTLRQQGFSNVYVVPAWSGTVRRTEVIAQRGDLNSAQVVQSVLGTGSVVSNSTGDLQSDLTIRVGEDWSETDRTGMIR
ncbi:LCP family protein [Leptolyngbya sp. PCC 6406]|uniref:LCP family protein n=1 Tax=Leptolyngbya sp. PCC 6406 TaxID=1173264 RepID=UPI0002AC102E|nr:LCP family protein [Leptolyngbya sp. PCC 6406]